MVIANAPDSVRERILEAAAEEFGRAGFSGAKVDAIARRAGVNKAGLYYHVGNKEKLYETVMLHLFGQVAGALEQAAGAPGSCGTPGEAFTALATALAGLFTKLPMLPRIMALEMASGGANMPAAAMAEFRRIFGVTRGILEKGAAQGALVPAEPVLVHLTLVGTMVVYSLSEPLRARFAAASQGLGLRLDSPLADAAAFVGGLLGKGLAAPAQPDASQETGHEND
ncbi:TetR/AcrR family transcriptional regulator [Solidesulfovibrio alcoholivorans]|uniref:TetR/AcrR family transcriptional regulator n=1 Tax=Solidesulfovibrio alcoholivorans TaxID=81406 RepID=UPI00049506B0|nr:TetR/AcrR family transcriptional regulator [Solidesulfovibrio alcoholivorans]